MTTIDNNNDNQDDDKCDKCNSGSETAFSTGALSIEHDLVDYRSLGVSRNVRLVYNSLRADPQPIINSNVTIFRRAAVPNIQSRLGSALLAWIKASNAIGHQ